MVGKTLKEEGEAESARSNDCLLVWKCSLERQ